METANITLSQSLKNKDWAAFYADLEKKANIPNASNFENKAGRITFRDTYLNLFEVKNKLKDIEKLVNVVLYTDTLEIPQFTNWVIKNTSLTIYARNIIVHDSSSIIIDYQNSDTGKLIVIGSEFPQNPISVKCVFNSDTIPKTFDLNAFNTKKGALINAKDNQAFLKGLSLAETTRLFPEEELLFYLNNAFIYASLLYDQHQELALSILLWVKALSSQNVVFQNLFYRSTSLSALLQSQINAKENGARFVPYLSENVYENLAGSFVEVAINFEQQYNNLSTVEALTENDISTAKAMIANSEAEIEFVNALLDQAKQNSTDATAAVEEAMRNFEDQNRAVKFIAINFETIGIPEYKAKVILEGMLDIVGALVSFSVSVGLMATGAGAGAGAAGATASVASVAKVAQSGAEVASLAKTLAETMEKLKELIETIQIAIGLAQSVKAVVNDISDAENQMTAIQEINDSYGDVDIASADNWNIFQIQASGAMKDPIELGIGFAKEYDEAMQILAIYGQSLSAAQLASTKADQELAAVFFQLKYAEEKKQNLEALLNDLQEGQALNLELKQALFQKHLDYKSLLFSALTSYKQSFFYWSFAESSINPKIIDGAEMLNSGLTDLTQITMDETEALERFNPPPQEMKNLLFSVEDEATIAELRNTQETRWVLPSNDPEFLGLERIRLDSIRVWIEGITFKNNEDSVFVTITNTGNYIDCYKGKGYQFTSKKLTRTFKYRIMDAPLNADWRFENNTWGLVQIDGKVDQEVRYAYFRPTPFSEWKISLKSNNPGIDLSKVRKLTMYFEGTAIGSSTAHALRLTEKLKLDVSK